MSAKTANERIYFSEVVAETIASPKKEPAVETVFTTTKDDMNAIIAACIKEGFDEGAIVALRGPDAGAVLQPVNWGVVCYINKYHADQSQPFKPLRVRWLNAHRSGGDTDVYSMNSLFLIHAAVERSELKTFLECQDPPWGK